MSGTRPMSAALACLTGLREGRAAFFGALAGRAAEHAPAERREADGSLRRDYLALLRSDGAAQIAELLFLIEELGLKDGARIRPFLVNHNAAMEAYLADPQRMRALGLTPQRVKAAMFPEERIGFIEFVSPAGQLYLDQSALGRLLTEVMAPESCRKIVIALAEGGLLHRHTLGNVLISSDGTLEGLYRAHLETVATAVRERS
jgi:hypothetical protein